MLCGTVIHGVVHCPEAAMNEDARYLRNAHFAPDKECHGFDF